MGTLFKKASPTFILWALARLVPERCADVFKSMRRQDPTLDQFAEAFLRHGFDSSNGQSYGVPQEVARLEQFVPLEELKQHALARLKDVSMKYPIRAAWRSVVEGRLIYGKDGTVKDD
jgi:hypothetical protein